VSEPKPMTLEEGISLRLRETRGPVTYADIADHLARDAVFIVSPALDLVACGVAVAIDDVELVSSWIQRGELRKPTPLERDAWPRESGVRWLAIVVQPFVLVHLQPDA
jgi:hypothetical protein